MRLQLRSAILTNSRGVVNRSLHVVATSDKERVPPGWELETSTFGLIVKHHIPMYLPMCVGWQCCQSIMSELQYVLVWYIVHAYKTDSQNMIAQNLLITMLTTRFCDNGPHSLLHWNLSPVWTAKLSGFSQKQFGKFTSVERKQRTSPRLHLPTTNSSSGYDIKITATWWTSLRQTESYVDSMFRYGT